MKTRVLITLAVVSAIGGWLAMPSGKVLAQNGPGCSGRCATQFSACQAAADATLEECLDRATTAREKGICAAAFVKLEDACREKEAACLSNCPPS